MIKKILLIRNDNIGDLICSTPAIEALKKRYPEAKIDILVNSYNLCAIQGNPFIHRIWSYTKTKHVKGIVAKVKAFFHKGWILYRLKKERYDCSVILRIAHSKHAELFSKAAGASMRIGVSHPQRKDSLTHPLSIQESLHEVMVCFECLRPLGVVYGDERTLWMVEEAQKRRFLEHQNKIILHISSRLEANRYPLESFRELIALLAPKECIITASLEDKAGALDLASAPNAEFLQTQSITELAALISVGSLFITLDGGALHMGPALGIPTLAIMGKTDPRRWAPWGEETWAITKNSPQEISEIIRAHYVL
ncbi:MAG: glycosyltransferase family 9 protein [Wolinella sp.]